MKKEEKANYETPNIEKVVTVEVNTFLTSGDEDHKMKDQWNSGE